MSIINNPLLSCLQIPLDDGTERLHEKNYRVLNTSEWLYEPVTHFLVPALPSQRSPLQTLRSGEMGHGVERKTLLRPFMNPCDFVLLVTFVVHGK
jgi:hypothetical protein